MAKALVVDDEPNIRHVMNRVLTRAGHEVTLAADGMEGVRLACAQPWDVVLLDLLLPDIPGAAALTAMLKARPDLRVMVVSCVGDTETRVSCLELGAVDFIVKPFSSIELVARVRSRLDLPHVPSTDGLLESGALRLDLGRRVLELDGVAIELSPREALLVQHLMRQDGGACTREELLQQVWDYAFEPDDDVVDLTVQGLRSKLPRDLIRAVGHGAYAIAAN